MNLSSSTRAKIDWQRMEASTAGFVTRSSTSSESAAAATASAPDPGPVFAMARKEFQRVLSSLNLLVRTLTILAGLSVVVCIVGVVVAGVAKQMLSGAALTVTGTGALIGLFNKIHAIGRDQAMLELIPVKYELALQLATAPEAKAKLLDNYLQEVGSLKSGS